MNKARREQIQNVIDALLDIKDSIDNICSDEQEYYDNMPDGIRDSERGEQAQSAISALESAGEAIDDVIPGLEEAQE